MRRARLGAPLAALLSSPAVGTHWDGCLLPGWLSAAWKAALPAAGGSCCLLLAVSDKQTSVAAHTAQVVLTLGELGVQDALEAGPKTSEQLASELGASRPLLFTQSERLKP